MDYRSPVLSLQHELETLETELAALRALPPAKPKKKARGGLHREARALRKSLKKISHESEDRSFGLGVRELTTGEMERGRSMRRLSLACVTVGAIVMGATVVVASSTRLVWTETTCTFTNDSEGGYVASYKVGGHTHTFGADREYSEPVRCCASSSR